MPCGYGGSLSPASTYYGWRERRRRPPRRALQDAVLLEKIKEIRAISEFGDTYGSPRVWLEPRRRPLTSSRPAA